MVMHPYLMSGLADSVTVIEALFRSIPESRWDERIRPERFSAREVIAHLADWEPILHGRMEAAVANPGAFTPALDEGQMAIENRYDLRDPHEDMRRFAAARQKTIAWLNALPAGAWTAHAMHPEKGRLTVDDMANMFLGHDLYHAEQLALYQVQPAGV